jgi:hypothetical protein
MAGGDDHWKPARDTLEERAGNRVAFGVGQRELLGIVGEQAQPVDPGVHQVVHNARRPAQVDGLVIVEDRRHDRHDAGQRGVHENVVRGRHRQVTVKSALTGAALPALAVTTPW